MNWCGVGLFGVGGHGKPVGPQDLFQYVWSSFVGGVTAVDHEHRRAADTGDVRRMYVAGTRYSDETPDPAPSNPVAMTPNRTRRSIRREAVQIAYEQAGKQC